MFYPVKFPGTIQVFQYVLFSGSTFRASAAFANEKKHALGSSLFQDNSPGDSHSLPVGPCFFPKAKPLSDLVKGSSGADWATVAYGRDPVAMANSRKRIRENFMMKVAWSGGQK
ncbi:hypothetical protein [Pedobacter yulinensis]|uniref:hypothetical protein n=1 Tax=Pedobacter yulinensis TaxID=2126353 RepID=UPI0019550CDB|nr:hypothetical protein [Pedobacter yulinensis]